jgi:hypothetical protein
MTDMVTPEDLAGMPFPCRDGPLEADCPANITLMSLVLERYPCFPRSAWIFAAMLGYFADATGVVASEWLRFLDVAAARMDIVASRQIVRLVASGFLYPVEPDVAGNTPCLVRISQEWVAAATAPTPLLYDADALLLDELELPEEK